MRLAPLLLVVAACTAPEASKPRGVVSLLPSWTEFVVELGAADRLVGCTDACEPGRDVARVPWRGPQATEAIVRLKPAVVLRQAPRAPEDPLATALAAAGIEVVSMPSETIADVRRAVLRIGDALGIAADATAYLERFDAAMVRARAGAVGKPRPKVLFVFGRDAGRIANVDGAGPGSFLDELIRYAGGRNLLADAGAPYPKVRTEAIVFLEPDVIIDNVPEGDDPLAAWQEFKTLPAVHEKRVYAVRDRALLIPGPHLPRSVERMVEMIHGRP